MQIMFILLQTHGYLDSVFTCMIRTKLLGYRQNNIFLKIIIEIIIFMIISIKYY